MLNHIAQTSSLPEQPNEKIHLAFLDSMRAIAAIYVVIHHALFTVVNITDLLNPASSLSLRQLLSCFIFGHYAVDAFIVLSGFCLMLPVIRGKKIPHVEAWSFLKKRARRILPTYYLALIFSLVLIWLFVGEKTGTIWDRSLPVTLRGLLTHLVMLQDVFYSTEPSINSSFWSLSVEWRIYFCFPILIFFWRRIGGFSTTVLSIILSYLFLFLIIPTRLNGSPWGICPHYLGLFAMGMLGAGICFSDNPHLLKLRHKLPFKEISLGAAVVVCLFSMWWLKNPEYVISFSIISLVVAISVVSLMIALVQDKHFWLTKVLSWKPIVFIGTFAYSIYLIHAPLLQLFWQYVLNPIHLAPTITFLLLCIIAIPIILVISYLFFLVCERPFLNYQTIVYQTPYSRQTEKL